jgi:acyl-CoA thioesterase
MERKKGETVSIFSKISVPYEREGQMYFRVTEDWTQGRAAFGGLVVASALRAMLPHVPAERHLRSLFVSFVAPVGVGEAKIRVELLRSGRALTTLEARVSQGETTCTVLLGSFGEAHERELAIEPPKMPSVPAAETLPDVPFMEGLFPNFAQHLAYRMTSEIAPYSGAERAFVQGWCRLRDAERVGYPEIAALIDAWWPPIVSIAEAPLAASSMTWLINFFAEISPEGLSPAAWWMYEGRSDASKGGYADTDSLFWDAQGRLIARSRQLVVEFS